MLFIKIALQMIILGQDFKKNFPPQRGRLGGVRTKN